MVESRGRPATSGPSKAISVSGSVPPSRQGPTTPGTPGRVRTVSFNATFEEMIEVLMILLFTVISASWSSYQRPRPEAHLKNEGSIRGSRSRCEHTIYSVNMSTYRHEGLRASMSGPADPTHWGQALVLALLLVNAECQDKKTQVKGSEVITPEVTAMMKKE